MNGLTALSPGDADRLAGLHAAAFERSWRAADFEALLASPGVGGLGAEAEGGLVGLILFRAVAGEAEILTLAVDPADRRRGLGRALVEAAAILAAGMGAGEMWLEVAEDNAAALALYTAAGFGPAGRRPGYYARGEGAAPADAVLMRRALNTGAASN